ncbi:MAG: DUF1059 domain-containing protein [Actinomycetota bacterium]|nr:DUF1059 domain-containing protein [Actinomycetota bacterium]
MFSGLDSTGRFHRDTPLGRIFHPGTVSYREISPNDSLHIAVDPENRISVHVDRVSPLAMNTGGRHQYSVLRVLHHNVTHGVDSLKRLCRRQHGDHRCEMDCEIVAVEDEVTVERPVMYEFSCKAAGATGCGWKGRAPSEEELLIKVADHARKVHGVGALSDTLVNYARTVARPVS